MWYTLFSPTYIVHTFNTMSAGITVGSFVFHQLNALLVNAFIFKISKHERGPKKSFEERFSRSQLMLKQSMETNRIEDQENQPVGVMCPSLH